MNFKRKILTLFVLFAFALSSSLGQNQELRQLNNVEKMPGIEEDQVESLKKLREEFSVKMKDNKEKVKELRQELNVLQVAEEVEKEKIYAKIDEIGKVEIEQMKQAANLIQDIRLVLNEEQRKKFDEQLVNGRKNNRKARGNGNVPRTRK